MSKRLRSTNDLIKDTLYDNVGYRLAETLHNLAVGYGKHTSSGLRIEIKFTDAQLAEFAGLPVEVIAAQLENWREAGLIDLAKGYITLLKPDQLAKLH